MATFIYQEDAQSEQSSLQELVESGAEQLRQKLKLPTSTETTSLLFSIVDKGQKLLTERLTVYVQELCDADIQDMETAKRLVYNCQYTEDYLMQTFRNKKYEDGIRDIVPNEDDANVYLPQIVLRKIHQDFLNDVSLDGTCIMDDLVLDKIMTEDERESIAGERTSKRRKEAFLQLMKGRLSCNALTTKFTPAVAKEHPDFAKWMKQVISEISHDPVSLTKCSVCNMKQHVLVKYIAGHLYANGSITENLYQELRGDLSNASKWIKLEESNVNPGLIFEAIQSQFPEVYKCLEGTTSLVCKCTIPGASGSESSSEDGTVTDIANEDDLASMLSHNLSITYSKGSAPTRDVANRYLYQMDELVLGKIMTEDERQSILGERTSKRRKETLLELMKARLSCNIPMAKFTPAIAEEYLDFADEASDFGS